LFHTMKVIIQNQVGVYFIEFYRFEFIGVKHTLIDFVLRIFSSFVSLKSITRKSHESPC